MQGVWGLDFLLADDELWALEVNPRYCASLELLERAYSLSMIALHVLACERDELPSVSLETLPRRIVGKMIVYAPRAGAFPTGFAAELLAANVDNDWLEYADISPDGTLFPAGGPLVTVFAEGDSVCEVEASLQQARIDLLRRSIPSTD